MQEHRTLQSILILGVLAISTGILFTSRLTAADGEWKQPADGDWNDPASWTGGVPTAGDVATFGDFPESDATITLDGPTIVGTLRSLNAHLLTFSGDVLTFDSGVADTAAVIDIPGVGGALQLDGELDLRSDLVVGPTEAYRSVSFNGSIVSGNHELTLEGGKLALAGDNSAWSGDVVVNGGTLQVTHASGLGDLVGETFVNGGQLTLSVATLETLHLNGGKVFLASADHVNAIHASGGTIFGVHAALTGELQLSGGTTTVQGVGLALSGEVTGTGDLHFAETRRGLIEINHPLSHTGTTSFDGLVNINVGGEVFQNQDLVFEGGTVTIGAGVTESVQAGTVLMKGTSSLTRAAGVDPSVGFSFSGPFTCESGTIGVPLQGTGSLIKIGAGTLALDQDNSYTGQTVINEGTVVVEHVKGLGGTAGNTVIHSDAALELRASIVEPLQLDGGSVHIGESGITLAAPIHLAGDGTILLSENDADFELAGPISGTGNLALTGAWNTHVTISGSNTYLGKTILSGVSASSWSASRFDITSPTAMGDASEGTILQSGFVNLQTVSLEPFRVEEDAILAINDEAANYSGTVTLAGGTMLVASQGSSVAPVIVESDGGLVRSTYGTWSGGSTGTGNLTIRELTVNGPLNHDGDLEVADVILNTANAYTGQTVVAGDTSVHHVGALGASDTDVIIRGGTLSLFAVPDRDYEIESGILDVQTSETPVTGTITLGGVDGASVSLRGIGVFTGSIIANSDRAYNNHIRGGTFRGTIYSDDLLSIRGSQEQPTNLEAANELNGIVRIYGTVNLNHTEGLNLSSTFLQNGQLNLNVPIDAPVTMTGGILRFNTPQDFSFPWVIAGGMIDASVEVGMSQLIFMNEGGNLGPEGVAVRIDDELRIMNELTLHGKVSGDGDIRLFGRQLYLSQNLPDFSGDIVLYNGYVDVRRDVANAGTIRVRSPEAGIYFSNRWDDDPAFDGDIYLSNAHGWKGMGAMATSDYAPTLRGRLDVGDVGSTISGAFEFEGTLGGHDLMLRDSRFLVHTAQDELLGTLSVYDASLMLSEAGQLHGLLAIELRNGGLLSCFNDIYPPGENLPDRVGDAIEIKSQGGGIHLNVRRDVAAFETLGTVRLVHGRTSIKTNSSDNDLPLSTLTLTNLVREPGATVVFEPHGGPVMITNTPLLENGMIGPWAITDKGFATIGADGIETVVSTSDDLNTADSTDHVGLTSDQVLLADTTIASLVMASHPNTLSIDLGGHQLVIESGGFTYVSGRELSLTNGTVTAGSDKRAELVLSEGGLSIVSAGITNNSSNSDVSLVVDNRRVRLSGNNSYSGGTWVVGRIDSWGDPDIGHIQIESSSAIPAHDRVHVDSGIYDLLLDSDTVVTLDELHLRGGGLIKSSGAKINAKRYYLEDGELQSEIVGGGEMVMDTHGWVKITQQNPTFHGPVEVRDGYLSVRGESLGVSTVTISGGQLNVSGESFNDIILDGGTLAAIGPERAGGSIRAAINGDIHVASESRLFAGAGDIGDASLDVLGDVSGSADLVVNGNVDDNYDSVYTVLRGDNSQFSGSIRIESGTFRIVAPNGAGTGSIEVLPGARLTVGRMWNNEPNAEINNNIHIHSGLLMGNSNRAVLNGDVTIQEDAMIGAVHSGGLTLAGRLILGDGSHLFGIGADYGSVSGGVDDIYVDVPGQILVGANTAWDISLSPLAITGEIRSNAQDALLDVLGPPELAYLTETSYHVSKYQTLSILHNGEQAALALEGDGNNIAGTGTLLNDISVTQGAAISPGNSAGLLTIDGDATLGEGGRFIIELGGLLRGEQYDALDVTGTATLDGLLDVDLINDFAPRRNDEFVVLSTENGLDGKFASANLPELDTDLCWNLLYNSNDLVLQVGIAGDYNGDGLVEQDDLDLVLLNWGRNISADGVPAGWLGDLPTGTVDDSELATVRANWGNGAASSADSEVDSVPEPAAWLLLLAGAVALGALRGKRAV